MAVAAVGVERAVVAGAVGGSGLTVDASLAGIKAGAARVEEERPSARSCVAEHEASSRGGALVDVDGCGAGATRSRGGEELRRGAALLRRVNHRIPVDVTISNAAAHHEGSHGRGRGRGVALVCTTAASAACHPRREVPIIILPFAQAPCPVLGVLQA